MKLADKLKVMKALEDALAILKDEETTDYHIAPAAAEVYAKLKTTQSKPFTWSDMEMYGPDLKELKAHWPIYPDPENADEMDTFWHGTTAKSGRSLNHCMNRMNKDWEVNSVRTPKGWRALTEVAVDNRIDVEMLVWAMLDHPRFGKEGSLFHKAAVGYLEQHPK